jgi:DNA polymerase-3 subunit chi
MPESPQVDFYQLGDAGLDAGRLACRLALMAWERGHRIVILAESAGAATQLDELMWESPAGRFLPHGKADDDTGARAPVRIIEGRGLKDADVVINLCAQPVTATDQFRRLLEIVPHRQADRIAAREKYRYYKDQGLQPAYHEISR